MRVLLLAHEGDDPRGRVELARGQRDRDRAVVAVRSDDDGRGGTHARGLEALRAARVADDAGVAAAGRLADGVRPRVDDDDRIRRRAVGDEGLGRGAALDAEAADDGVVAQSSPPDLLAVMDAGALGQHLERGAHQDDEEQDAGRRDQQRRDQARLVGDRRDVPVAGSRDAHGGVVEGVEQVERRPVDVAITVPVGVGHERDEGDQPDRDQDPPEQVAQRRVLAAREADVGTLGRHERGMMTSGSARRVPPCRRSSPGPKRWRSVR
jgi:hypothetical protein